MDAIAGFERAGIYPLNRDKIDSSKLKISTAYERILQVSSSRKVARKAKNGEDIILLEQAKNCLEIFLKDQLRTTRPALSKSKRVKRPYGAALTLQDAFQVIIAEEN